MTDAAPRDGTPLADARLVDVVKREGARLRRFIQRRVHDTADAEDVLQDVYTALVEANRLLMPVEHLTGWLFQAARNRIVDGFRKKTPARLDDLAPPDEALRWDELLPSPAAGPEAALAHSRLLDALEAAIAALPDDERTVFVAHAIDGRSFKAIAAETGVNLNTLLSRKHHAVRRLRARLAQVHDDLDR